MKKIISMLSLALVICLALFAMTACGGDEVTIGENGNWFIGEEDTGVKASASNVAIGQNGNWFIDGKDSGTKAVGTDAEKVTIGENGNWFIGATDTGVKAVNGKYVVDVKSSTELDHKSGKRYAVTVVTYSDGTTETQKNEILDAVRYLSVVSNGSGNYYAGFKPLLTLRVETVSGYTYSVKITDDMYFGAKPDFNTAGVYPITVVYGGQNTTSSVTVVDATGVSVVDTYLSPSNLKVGTAIADASVYVRFSTSEGYDVSLADCTVSGGDFNTAGENLSMDVTYGGYTEKLNYSVYDPAVNNIQGFSLMSSLPALTYQADANAVTAYLNTNIIGRTGWAHFYESIYGMSMEEITITEDMVDASKLNSNMLGRQVVYVDVEIEGVGTYLATLSVSVEADVSGATLLKTYTNSTPVGSILGTISAYDNGIAVISGMGGMQAAYTANGNFVTAVTSGMTLYFTIDNTNDTYEVYVPAGEQPSATYVASADQLKICVYSDCVTIGMLGSTPEDHVPIYSLSKSCLNGNKLSLGYMTITLNEDGTATTSYD